MKNVILIAGSFTSANFNVMLDIINAVYDNDVYIHALSANNDRAELITQYPNVHYYPVHNKRLELFKQNTKNLSIKAYRLILARIFSYIDNFAASFHERTIKQICDTIIQTNTISAIYSVCMPFYSHRIAFVLSEKHKIKWYAFWVDSYINKQRTPSYLLYKCMEYAENKNMQHAEKIYTLRGILDNNELRSKYIDKIVCFDFPYLRERKVNRNSDSIVFAGVFYKDLRNPEPVFQIIIKALQLIPTKFVFDFYTNSPELYSEIQILSNGRIRIHCFVNRNELNCILSNAFMLMNVGNRMTTQMPSKVIEYISYRKPIIFFYSNKDDVSFRYFNEYPDCLAIDVNGDIDANAALLSDYISSMHSDINFTHLIKSNILSQCTPEYIRNIID